MPYSVSDTTQTMSANWTQVAGQQVVADYGIESAEALAAATTGVALLDRSHWGRIRLTGADRRKFLHNMTTADVNGLPDGGVLPAVLVTATARIVDYVMLLAREGELLMLASPERGGIIPGWLGRFIFFNDNVQVEDDTPATAMFTLIGPQSHALLATLGVQLAEDVRDRWQQVVLADAAVFVVPSVELGVPAYNLIVAAHGEALWQRLRQAGATFGLALMGETAWEQLRIQQGLPRADRELTEEHNPLEAGLWHAVSFAKGCYIGQEIIARLDTYQKIKQRLMAVHLDEIVEVGTGLVVDGDEVGTLTSVTPTEAGALGLAFVRNKAATVGQPVQLGTRTGILQEAQALTWGRTDLPS
jgi:folate-binding protein YgfZ